MVSSILISSIMVVYLVKYGNCNNLVVEEEPYIVYRPGSSFLCPPRAVCADEFTYRRTLNNETTILKRRIFNCRCDHISHDACPITAENMIYASEINKQFLCRPIATLPECNEQENPDRIAQELEDKSPIFFNRNYYRINCVCQRHFNPLPKVVGELNLSTKYRRTEVNHDTFRKFLQFVCSD